MAIRILTRLWPSGDFTIYPEPKVLPPKDDSTLGLSLPNNSHNSSETTIDSVNPGGETPTVAVKPRINKAPRGSGGLTTYGAKMIRSACQLIQEKAEQRPVAMLTLTLPSMDTDQLAKANKSWSEIMRQFNQELRRELERAGLPLDYVYATEWQKRGALHAHIVFIASQNKVITSASQYPISKSWFKETWQRILSNVLNENYNCNAATRIEKVKTAVGAYMSKYLSKGDKPKRKKSKCILLDETLPDVEQMSDDKIMHICDASIDDTLFCTLQTSVREYVMSFEDEDIEHRRHAKEFMQTCIDAMNERRHQSANTLQICHPSSWWGANKELKRQVLDRVETWSRKIQTKAYFSAKTSKDKWLEYAQRIVDKIPTYWNKIVTAGNDFPRAISGRMRLDGSWRESASKHFFGVDITEKAIIRNDDYWRWRYKRDGCNPEQDSLAKSEWIRKHYRASVTYGLT